MERTKHPQKINIFPTKSPDAILTGDWHLREDTPVCRTEPEYQTAQWEKVDFVSELQKRYKCPVIHSGDLFNHWKPSPWLLSMTMQHLPKEFYTIYGNHDLPQHNLGLADKCGIYVLAQSEHLQIYNGSHWGQPPSKESYVGINLPYNRNILVWHVMTYQGKKPWPGCTDPMSAALLRKFPEYDLILTGHNHKTFVEEYQGRLLVNPGSIFRQTADQMNHQPCVFLWYAETNTVVPIYLPIKDGVISREHIADIEKRDNRIDAFISRLDAEWDVAMSFEENLEAFAAANKVKKPVMDIIYQAIES